MKDLPNYFNTNISYPPGHNTLTYKEIELAYIFNGIEKYHTTNKKEPISFYTHYSKLKSNNFCNLKELFKRYNLTFQFNVQSAPITMKGNMELLDSIVDQMWEYGLSPTRPHFVKIIFTNPNYITIDFLTIIHESVRYQDICKQVGNDNTFQGFIEKCKEISKTQYIHKLYVDLDINNYLLNEIAKHFKLVLSYKIRGLSTRVTESISKEKAEKLLQLKDEYDRPSTNLIKVKLSYNSFEDKMYIII